MFVLRPKRKGQCVPAQTGAEIFTPGVTWRSNPSPFPDRTLILGIYPSCGVPHLTRVLKLQPSSWHSAEIYPGENRPGMVEPKTTGE